MFDLFIYFKAIFRNPVFWTQTNNKTANRHTSSLTPRVYIHTGTTNNRLIQTTSKQAFNGKAVKQESERSECCFISHTVVVTVGTMFIRSPKLSVEGVGSMSYLSVQSVENCC